MKFGFKKEDFLVICLGRRTKCIVLLILLNVLGIGTSFGALDIQEERNPAKGLGIGAGIWYLLSSLIALFAAAWVAG